MTPEDIWSDWMQDGDRYYQEGAYCEALNAYTIGLQMNPNNPLLLSKKGNTLYMLQQYEAADLVYAEALNNSNAVVIVYEYILKYSNDVEANLWWLQDLLHSQYQVEILYEGLARVVHQVEQEILEQANHSTTNTKQFFLWTPFLDKILKNLGIPYASSLINMGRLLQQNKPQKNVGLLQKKPINRMTWQQFELFLQWSFEQQGYKVRKTKKSGDQGADLVLENLGIKTVVQIKKRKKTTGNDAVQQVHAARGFYEADRAIVISSTKFSKHAVELANRLNVELWDWQRVLTEMKTLSK